MAILTDLRHAVRLLGRSPVFTLTSIASLAIGIGAAATIFSLTDALLFKPSVGVRNASEVVDIGRSDEGSGFDNMSHPRFEYLRGHTQTLQSMAAVDFGGGPMSLGENGSSERIFGTMVSGSYFDVLGTRPALGRFFRADEDTIPGERPVVVLSHAFWQRRFKGDPEILQKPMRLNNREFAVVGVAEPGFLGASMVGTDVWVPMAMVAVVRGEANADMLTDVRGVWHLALGRLKPGVAKAQAEAELNTLNAAFNQAEPRANQRHTIAVIGTSRVPGPVRLPFLAFIGFLFALTGALVAIACSNVAGMLLARAATRRREMATRLAVGAGRGRLIRQLLIETIVLFAAAAVAALPITFWLIALLEGSLSALPVIIDLDLSVNWRVLTFVGGLALVTAIVFGLAPARHALGADLAPMLHGAHSTADRRHFRLRNSLVVAQVALSLMLVVIAFLFVRTLQGGGLGLGRITVPGVAGTRDDGAWEADWDIVSPDYFRTIDMGMVEGRAFTAADREGAPQVTIINATFARRAFPGQSAIGRQLMHEVAENDIRPLEIVGVAQDAKYRYISETGRNFIYVPLRQHSNSHLEFFIRHAAARPMERDIRSAFAQVESNVPIVMLQSFDDATALGLLPQRLTAWIAGSVGTIGVFLAALGLYGLMAFLVAQRTREIAIRMALGASNGNMQSMVLKQAARLGVIGGIVGLLLAGAIGMLVQSLLVGVPPLDPVAFGGTALLFCAVLSLAAWSPARRAAATDPATALRAE